MAENIFNSEFWSDVLKQVIRRTRDSANAEDYLQDAFLRLERYRADHVVENPAAFLVQAAVNIRVDDYRRARRLSNFLSGEGTPKTESQPLQDEVICARERLKRTKAGLDSLPERTREILLMHRLERLKYREIADRLGISQSAVEKHIAKGVLFLAGWTEGW